MNNFLNKIGNMGNKKNNDPKEKLKKAAKKKIIIAVAPIIGWILLFIFGIVLAFGVVYIGANFVKTAVEYVENAKNNWNEWWDSWGNWWSGHGWNTSENAFFEELNKKKEEYKAKNVIIDVPLIISTSKYYYDRQSIEMTSDNYYDLIGSTKKLADNMVSCTSYRVDTDGDGNDDTTIEKCYKDLNKYKNYVLDSFLEESPQKKLLEGYNDEERTKRKEELYSDIELNVEIYKELYGEYSEFLDGNKVCYGEYLTASDTKIDISNATRNITVALVKDPSTCSNNATLTGCTISETVPWDDYIKGVTYAEMGPSASLESTKAQMVASQSYAIGRATFYNRWIDNGDGTFTIKMINSTTDQVYISATRGGSAGGQTKGPMSLEQLAKFDEAYEDIKYIYLLTPDGSFYGPYNDRAGNNQYCQVGSCMGTSSAIEKGARGQDYKSILATEYQNVSPVLADVSDGDNPVISVSSVKCYDKTGGQIRKPVDNYTITSNFGYRTSPSPGNHSGIDLAAPLGTPVYAIAPGIVVPTNFNSGGYGNYVVLAHDLDSDGRTDYFTLYGHLSKKEVSDGGINVNGGQKIGEVGSTGRSTGNHLHFEVRKVPDGNLGTNWSTAVAVDPKPFLDDIDNGTSIFNEMIKTEKKYYNQGEYASVPYCSGNDTVKNAGCLPTSFAMIVSYLRDSSFTPVNIATTICGEFNQYVGAGTYSTILTDSTFLAKYNLKSTQITSNYEEEIKNALNNSKPIIVNVRNGKFNPSGAGHYFTLMGINGDKVEVYDPGNRSLNGDHDISEFIDNITGGIWIFE